MEATWCTQPVPFAIFMAYRWKKHTCSAAKNLSEVRAGMRGRSVVIGLNYEM